MLLIIGRAREIVSSVGDFASEPQSTRSTGENMTGSESDDRPA
jgi:hypothetical protein